MFTVRLIEEADLPALVEAERLSTLKEFHDPDFGELVVPQGKTAWDFMRIIRQRKGPDGGDTRTYVVQDKVRRKADTGRTVTIHRVCGGFAYERAEDSIWVVYLTLRPDCKRGMAMKAVLSHLKKIARGDSRRRKVVWVVPDDGQLGTIAPALMAESFSHRLEPDWFGDRDGWKFTFEA